MTKEHGWFFSPKPDEHLEKWDPEIFLDTLENNKALRLMLIALRDKYAHFIDSNVGHRPAAIPRPVFAERVLDERIKVCYVLKDGEKQRGIYYSGQREEFPSFIEWKESNDDELGGFKCDIYDALVANLAVDDFLVTTLTSEAAFDCVRGNVSMGVSIIVWPLWIFAFVFRFDEVDRVAVDEYVSSLRVYETNHNCRFFPSIDDCMFFAQKEPYLRRIFDEVNGRNDLNFKIVPTLFVSGDDWQQQAALEFAKEQNTERLVFKRSFSGESRHVDYLHVNDVEEVRSKKMLVVAE